MKCLSFFSFLVDDKNDCLPHLSGGKILAIEMFNVFFFKEKTFLLKEMFFF